MKEIGCLIIFLLLTIAMLSFMLSTNKRLNVLEAKATTTINAPHKIEK